MSAELVRLTGLIGWPVSHSLSPLIHGHWIEEHSVTGVYVPLPVRPENFGQVVASLPRMGFVGVNTTVPHKEAAFALAAELDEDARATGAVNVLVFRDGQVIGQNTDALGFSAGLTQTLGTGAVARGPCVVLGAGGAARAIVLALLRDGAPEIRVVNRTRSRAEMLVATSVDSTRVKVTDWEDWRQAFNGACLLVNTTSLGMAGKKGYRVPLELLPATAAVADIVYNPLETDLLRRAAAGGHRTVDGLGMLMHQAVPAFAAWFGVTPTVTPALRTVLEGALRARAA